VKVAFTTSGQTLDAPLEPRFGRAPCFLVDDLETGELTVIDNTQSLNAAQGAGIHAAEIVIRAGAQSVVSGHFGPKAFRVMAAAGIEMFTTDAPTVADALARFRSGTLKRATAADVEGHWV